MKTTKFAAAFYVLMALLLCLWLWVYLKSPEPQPVSTVVEATARERQSAEAAVKALLQADDGKNSYSAYLQDVASYTVLPKVSLNQVGFAAGGAVSDGYGNVRGFRLCGKTSRGSGFYLDLSRSTDGSYTVSAVAADDTILPALEQRCAVLFLSGQQLYAATQEGLVYPASQWASDLFPHAPPMTLTEFNAALISTARQADFWFGHILSPGGAIRTLVFLGVLILGTCLCVLSYRAEKCRENHRSKGNVIYWK